MAGADPSTTDDRRPTTDKRRREGRVPQTAGRRTAERRRLVVCLNHVKFFEQWFRLINTHLQT